MNNCSRIIIEIQEKNSLLMHFKADEHRLKPTNSAPPARHLGSLLTHPSDLCAPDLYVGLCAIATGMRWGCACCSFSSHHTILHNTALLLAIMVV